MKKHLFLAFLLFLLAFGGILLLGLITQTEAHGKGMPPASAYTVAHGEGMSPASECTLAYDKTATPTEVDEGGAMTVTFSLQSVGDCSATNSSVDVMLVIDRSGSMGGQKIADAKQAASNFVNQMDLSVDQVGLASFASTGSGTLDSPLTQNASDVITAINGLVAGGMTNIVEGLEIAETELITSGRHITTSAPVIVILSDGHHNESSPDELADTADRIKGEGIRIISIGLGDQADENQLRAIASSDDDYYYAPLSSDLGGIYQSIASTVRVAARNMVITDTLSIYDTLVPGSFQGPIFPTVNGNQIVWRIAAVPTGTITLTYQAAMTSTPGTWDTNESAVATYIDANGNPAAITFPVPQVTVTATCGQPDLVVIEPTWGCVGVDTAVELFGSGFVLPTASIGSQALTIHSSQNDYISATLPAGLAANTYDVTVVNTCQLSDTLPAAFNVYPVPNVLSVRPPEGYNDVPSEITICGDGFAPGTVASIQVISGTITLTIPLDNQARYGERCLVGTVRADLPEGEHDIIVQGPCGTATGTYRLLSPALNDDLWARAEELWIDPSICAREDDDIKMGLIVHRRGGKNPLSNVIVRFYEGDPAEAVLIGDGVIYELPARVTPSERISGYSTTEVAWTPSQGVGEYTLYAVVDPFNLVTEDHEDNNVVSRTVQVLPAIPGIDRLGPHVDEFEIDGGAEPVYDRWVDLHVQATDFAQPGSIPSGLAHMQFVEQVYNEAAGVWVPVQASGWLTFAEDTTWTLYPQSGLRYLQAWASDVVGNISHYPYQQSVNYLYSCIPLDRYATHVYRQYVEKDDILYVEVIPCEGDPDLYIWPPDWEEGDPPWVSPQPGMATEVLSITAPISGTYQIEVYGYTAAQYSIQIEVEAAGSAQSQHSGMAWMNSYFTISASDKVTRTIPAVPPDSEPRAAEPSPPPAAPPPPVSLIYLPLVVKGQ